MSGVWERWVGPIPARYPTPDACRFIRAEDFLALALKAYLAASRQMEPPAGEPWVEAGATWADAEGFYDALRRGLTDRLRRAAVDAGHLLQEPWSAEDWAELGGSESPPGAGRSPADKGHGWPAFAPAVGPAPMPCPGAGDGGASQQRDITIPADPLFCGQQVQKLPGDNRQDNLGQHGEKIA